MAANYRVDSTKFFNAQTGESHRAWADAAAAYFSSVAGVTKPNFVDAMSVYYSGIENGTISAPVQLAEGQAVATNGASAGVRSSTGSTLYTTGTVAVSDGALSSIRLPATATAIVSGATLTGVTPTGTYASTVTFTVANGAITAIALS